MGLLEYNPENCGGTDRAGKPTLSISAAGAFILNREAQQLIGTDDKKQQVKLFQDESEETTWYICAVESLRFPLRSNGQPYKDGSSKLAFNNSHLARLIYDSCGNPELGLRIPISNDALEIEETGFAYTLITAAAKS